MKLKFTQITSILKKFTPEELKTLIPQLLPDIGWDAVNTAIKKNRLSYQSKFIAMITSSLYEASNPSNDNVQFVLWALQLCEKIHHNTQNWYGIQLLDQVEEVNDTKMVERNIIRAFRTHARDAEVMLKLDEDHLYTMLIEKKTSSNGVKYKRPFFFVFDFSLPQSFAFYSPKFYGCEDLLTYCCKGIGYENYTSLQLSGQDINSLFGMIERELNNSFIDEKSFNPVTVKEEDGVVDFTLGKEREKFAEEILPGLTKLKHYTIQAENEWRGAPYLPDMNGVTINSAITIDSSHKSIGIEEIFKEMITIGMVSFPLPSYLLNLPNLGKNVIELKGSEDTELDVDQITESSFK